MNLNDSPQAQIVAHCDWLDRIASMETMTPGDWMIAREEGRLHAAFLRLFTAPEAPSIRPVIAALRELPPTRVGGLRVEVLPTDASYSREA